MEFISDSKARQRIYKSRKMNLMKKAHELSTLCDIDTCLIILDTANNLQLSDPEIWPENPNNFNKIMQRYFKNKCKGSVCLPEMSVKHSSDEKNDRVREVICRMESKIDDVNRRIEYLKSVDLEKELKNLTEMEKNRPMIWTNPPENWIKINFGGAIYDGITSSVCIARNHSGSAIGCWTMLLPQTSQQVMESNALCLAIHTALVNHFDKVIFEGDSEWIVSEINASCSSAIHSIEEAKTYLKQHEFWQVKHVHWSTNEAVFELAHWALECGYYGVLQPHEIPAEVSSVIAREIASGCPP